MRKLLLQIRVFFGMLLTLDGTGHVINVKDAYWYATNLEWWGVK